MLSSIASRIDLSSLTAAQLFAISKLAPGQSLRVVDDDGRMRLANANDPVETIQDYVFTREEIAEARRLVDRDETSERE